MANSGGWKEKQVTRTELDDKTRLHQYKLCGPMGIKFTQRQDGANAKYEVAVVEVFLCDDGVSCRCVRQVQRPRRERTARKE